MLTVRIIIVCWVVISCLSCQSGSDDPLFILLPSAYTGVDFANNLAPTDSFNMYTYRNFYNGGGVGIGDINNDGWADIFFCGNLVDNTLYLNKKDFRFEDITAHAGVASENIWSAGVSMADVNGDGWLDIYVCKSGKPGGAKRYNELFINNGDLTFSEVAHEYGIADEGFSSHAAFFDYDRDGDLDCYLLNNSFRSVGGYDMRPGLRDIRDTLGGNKLYRNMLVENGTGAVTFIDVSAETGIYGSAIGFGLGVTIGDINNDGWPDIYVSNDFFERDYLYLNLQDGTFKEDLTLQMRETSMGSMGADLSDINNDGWADLFVTEMLPRDDYRYKTKMTFENWDKYQLAVQSGYHHQFTRNVLQLNNKNETFSEIGRLAGVEATDWSWGALISDFDLDGWKDIFVANGIYKDLLDQDYIHYYSNDPKLVRSIRDREPGAVLRLIDRIPTQAISNYFFKNSGSLFFQDVTRSWGMDTVSFSNGSAYADLDNDGDLDLVVNNCNMPAFMCRNQASDDTLHHRYLRISLQGRAPNTFAIGSKVILDGREQVICQELFPMRGFQSSTDYTLVMGVGDRRLVDLKVIWPDGTVTIKNSVSTNQHLILNQDSEIAQIPKETPLVSDQLWYSDTQAIAYRHTENEFVDFDRNRLLFHMISVEGPKVVTGDVNGDELEDIFITSSSGYSGAMFIQTLDGSFTPINESVFEIDKRYEDCDAAFCDIDGDQDLDLIVTSGGNEFRRRSPQLADRIYLNDGKGVFRPKVNAFVDPLFESSSCVRPCDFDQDGDQDLFIGTRFITGIYGLAADGQLWENDGQGQFKRIGEDLFKEVGLITDAIWFDYDGDLDQDLCIVGEWMPVTVFQNNGDQFVNVTQKIGLEYSDGFWNTVAAEDLDGDGHEDLVLGNHGLNSRFRASRDFPLEIYVNDFDGNKTAEQIITKFSDDQSYPLVFRDDLVMQIPDLKKSFLLYEDYGEKTMEDIFSDKVLRTSAHREVYDLSTSIAWNNDGVFNLIPLPIESQFSPVHAIAIGEFDEQPGKDVLLGGNFYWSKPEVGKYDASYGALFANKGAREFDFIPALQSGINILGEIRDFSILSGESNPKIIAVRNNQSPILLTRNVRPPSL